MKKLFSFMNKIEEFILIILMLFMTIAVVFQVLSRTILNVSPAWTEEVARYMLVWITFIGASLGVKRGAHIGVEAFTRILPKNKAKFVGSITALVCLLFTFTVFVTSIKILKLQLETSQVSAAVQIPMWLPYAGITVGMLLMSIRFLEVFINSFEKDDIKVIEKEGGME